MVKPFQFARLPKIVFGQGTLSQLPGIVRKWGNTVILVTGKRSFLSSPAGEMVQRQFKEKGILYSIVQISGEPSPGMVDDAVNRFRGEPVSAVVGLGGGSVLDAGKAISAMLDRTEPVMEFLEGIGTREHPGTKVPFVAIPTTSGTGSEATKNAVLSQTGPNGFKKSLRHDNFVPDIAIIDPALTLCCPPEITAAAGMDCFTQLTEAYLSGNAIPYTDALAFEGLKAIKSSLLKSYLDGQDIEARTEMSFAALTSGICLANAGLGVVHGFASSVGGLYDIPHGVLCGSLMAKANEINVRELRKQSDTSGALRKYTQLGMLFLDKETGSDDYFIDGFIAFLHELTGQLKLPGLKKYGIRESDLEQICSVTEMKNNPVKLAQADLMEIIAARWE